jgi:putative ABC transport system permease protein
MFQFSIAIILIAGLMIVYKQIDYVKHRNIGFKSDQLLYLNLRYPLPDRVRVLSDKLQQYNGVRSLTKTFGVPGTIYMSVNGYKTMDIDSATLKTFDFKLIKGRDLLPGDIDKAVIINETALNKLEDKNWENQKINGMEIVGVVSDFNYSSLYNKVGPFLMEYGDCKKASMITMRIVGPIGEAVNYINKTWKEICPDYPIDLNFYDEHFASMYRKEENLASLVSIFSILAVVISCLGIFGLSVFQSEQKIKEVGIRKVLGATVPEIVLMLTKSFSIWIVFANIIAWPVAYYFMNKWLHDFAYRINISWWIFVIAGGIALVIAMATVSLQAIKAAVADPVKTLRYE